MHFQIAALRRTQPAVCDALGRLRRITGDRLFVRVENGVVPTPRAEAMAGDVAIALERAVAAFAETRPFDPATSDETIRLGMDACGTAVLLPPLVAALRAEAPGLSIRAVPSDLRDPLADLDAGRTVLAVSLMDRWPDRFAGAPLLEEELVCIVSEEDGLPAETDLDFYLARPHVVVSHVGDPHTWADDRLARIYDHPLERRHLVVNQTWHRRFDDDPMQGWLRGRFAELLGGAA